MVKTEFAQQDVPLAFQRFMREIGAEHWHRMIKKIDTMSGDNAFIKDYLLREHAIAVQLAFIEAQLCEHGAITAQFECAVYDALGLIVQVLSIMDADPEYAPRLVGRVRGALADNDQMRGLLLELKTAVHLNGKGYKLHWPDIRPQENVKACDFTIINLSRPINIDCKDISEDTGRKITRWSCGLLFGHINARIMPNLRGLNEGIAITVTVPGRLTDEQKTHWRIADEVAKAVLQNTDCTMDDLTSIRISHFDPSVIDPKTHTSHGPELRKLIAQVSNTANANAMIQSTDAGGAVILIVQSLQPNRPMAAMAETLKQCAKKQLPPDQPGIIVAGLALREGAFRRLVQDSRQSGVPNAFHRLAHRFRQSNQRNHVVSLVFLESADAKKNDVIGEIRSIGETYIFDNKTSPLWLAEVHDIFR